MTQTFLSFLRFSLIWKFCRADDARAAWMAASAIGLGPLFSAFSFFSFCVTSNWMLPMSICCWAAATWGISTWGSEMVGRFEYSLGALLRTTGVGSEWNDLSDCCWCCCCCCCNECGMKLDIKAGWWNCGGACTVGAGGFCWSFCWTVL